MATHSNCLKPLTLLFFTSFLTAQVWHFVGMNQTNKMCGSRHFFNDTESYSVSEFCLSWNNTFTLSQCPRLCAYSIKQGYNECEVKVQIHGSLTTSQTIQSNDLITTSLTPVNTSHFLQISRQPTARYCRITSQSISSGSSSIIDWDQMVYNDHQFPYDVGSITIPMGFGGLYKLIGNISFQSSVLGGVRRAQITVNSVAISSMSTVNAPLGNSDINLNTEIPLQSGDVVAVVAQQSAGVNLNVVANCDLNYFVVTRISD